MTIADRVVKPGGFVGIVSWHILRPFTTQLTLCGRWAHQRDLKAGYAKELPLGDPSCETCRRLAARLPA